MIMFQTSWYPLSNLSITEMGGYLIKCRNKANLAKISSQRRGEQSSQKSRRVAAEKYTKLRESPFCLLNERFHVELITTYTQQIIRRTTFVMAVMQVSRQAELLRLFTWNIYSKY